MNEQHTKTTFAARARQRVATVLRRIRARFAKPECKYIVGIDRAVEGGDTTCIARILPDCSIEIIDVFHSEPEKK